ncbi:3-methyl-2-oxobutanoate hydroxymethyltransferase [Hyperthermus butylicus]|uniref:3-methyl-2-oxobutanoate hydroxymethyltransferase n=1 Tax=Hyperthermus butylicus (strain DSM 5456 / JCM 9403 / PLM1-5) TaxID=415426 RepID=PANB_HYPBU|nr:3-methyl-2-oxobutanoate hydroxymethyltransferase [Hyperthermus butylicus]A2BMY4.1 RecName: Full=3-methyl-2-oxobutanoate hydroxymethyltransferase; AltName: Full=Ketopantoate hydroxymethyltransferase; Short=KPHMT [Hyperthermus butylicus DSM 5456]ABM81345.1 3-methyl-2-oxobutanoate hydroxymethyltransferase [Hyperthermus butylicus DSM 5456]
MAGREKVTVRDIVRAKQRGERIVMVTAYDYITAKLVDEAGVDMILVGDSLGMVVLGLPSTHQVTLEDMERHTAAVARAQPRALIVADMPFMSYEASTRDAVLNAGRLIAAGADAVKIEGGASYSDTIRALVRAGIPVVAHVGLTPQRYKLLGGYRLAGKTASEAMEVIREAIGAEEAGAFAVVIEFTAWEVAREITRKLSIPTICIGSGPYCDGQVLVIHDLLGLTPTPPPFAKKYVDLAAIIRRAVSEYASDVRNGRFPGEGMYWGMKRGEYEKLQRLINEQAGSGD